MWFGHDGGWERGGWDIGVEMKELGKVVGESLTDSIVVYLEFTAGRADGH